MTFSFEPNPPPEASGYFAAKNLRPAFRWGQVWREEHAIAFTIAKMTQLELLAHVQASLQDALDNGTPYAQWAKELTPSLQKAGWWGKKEVVNPVTGELELVQLGSPRRLKLIYQANLASARAAGQWERAQRTKGVAPYFLYVQTSSVDPRDEHLTWVGTLLPVDHPWWAAHFPPNGWRCKCQVRQVSQPEFERLGGERKPAVFQPVAYRRRLDDGTKAPPVMVPGGIDPGWDTSPGLARTTTIMDAFVRSLRRAPPMAISQSPPAMMPQAQDFIEAAAAKGREVQARIDAGESDVDVRQELSSTQYVIAGVLQPDIAAALKADRIVRATEYGIGHGSSKDVKPEDWVWLQRALDSGEVMRLLDRDGIDKGLVRFLIDGDDNKVWEAVLKPADDGTWLVTYYAWTPRGRKATSKRENVVMIRSKGE
jgi:hypothetical protein